MYVGVGGLLATCCVLCCDARLPSTTRGCGVDDGSIGIIGVSRAPFDSIAGTRKATVVDKPSRLPDL